MKGESDGWMVDGVCNVWMDDGWGYVIDGWVTDGVCNGWMDDD